MPDLPDGTLARGRARTRRMPRFGLVAALAVAAAIPFAGGSNAASAYSLVVSSSADRSAPVVLDGATVSAAIFVFTTPATDVREVRFWLDNPARAGSPRKVERGAPHDFAGTATNGAALPFDTTTLSDGQHSITAEIVLTSGLSEVVTAAFTVANGSGPPPPPPPSAYDLYVSSSPARSEPRPLAGLALQGNAYIFTQPAANTKEVRFYLDDPTRSRAPRKIEKGAPHDFVGTASNGDALPFDTRTISDGQHVITAEIYPTAGGTEVVSASFTVANSGPVLQFTPSNAGFATEPGVDPAAQTVSLAASDGGSAAASVSDDAAWLSVTPTTAATPATLSLTVEANGLSSGTYTATVTATASGYGAGTLRVTLDVQGSTPPDQIHLSWVDDPATSLTVVWRTQSAATPSHVEYRPTGTSTWLQRTGALRPSGTDGSLHEATLSALTPSTSYDYRVLGDGGAWSNVYTTRTAPPRGPADFDAVYVADTGLVGRTDGLATGTQQVVDEIAALSPDLVLLGGDYAYYNTDKRYGSLDDTIDAWFNQMQPIGARVPMMVAYGNHEILLEETFADWSPRFATPEGFDGRRHYSFRVGDVHFVSILAVSETSGLSSGTLAWIEQDILAARAAGARWIVPFFHVSPFSDGSSHPSNLTLRGQLGPLFERLGVKIALSSHDQSYERTYPLRNVPSSNTPTTTARRCYTLDDGVTWAKISPGGKLSSKNGDFSQFKTTPPQAYIAVRDNTMHHFARLRVSAAGTLALETYGLRGDGSPPVLVDRFEYTTGSCPGELRFAQSDVAIDVDAGATGERTLSLGSSSGSAAYTVTDDAPWLTVVPSSGTTPATLTLRANAAGLAPGTYTANVEAAAPGQVADVARVTLRVHDMLVSTSPDRSSPIRLAGSTVSKRIYVYTEPHLGVTRVRFWLNNPSMSGSPRKIENGAPFDFAGTATSGAANPFDTTKVANGTHTITAAVDLASGGTKVVHSTFTVSNAS